MNELSVCLAVLKFLGFENILHNEGHYALQDYFSINLSEETVTAVTEALANERKRNVRSFQLATYNNYYCPGIF